MPGEPSQTPLHVLLQGEPAAAQQARLAASLAARGHRVSFADAPLLAEQALRDFGSPCPSVRVLRWAPPPLRQTLVGRRLSALGVDVVHLNYLHPRQDVFARLGSGGPPYVATAWGSDVNTEVFEKSRRWLSRLGAVVRGASAVTADSHPLLDRCRALHGDGPAPPPFEHVFFGVDLEGFHPDRAADLGPAWRRRLDIPEDAGVVLSARKLRPHYHNDLVLEAFAASRWAGRGVLLLKHHGRPAEDAHLRELEARAGDLGIADRLRVAPPVPYQELAGLYGCADLAVSYPSVDGVPSAFFELMALEVPIVATDLPAYDGVLDDGRTGLRVPHGDVPALTAALDRLLPGSGERAGLTTAALALARDQADWERCVDRFEALYRGAVHDRAGV